MFQDMDDKFPQESFLTGVESNKTRPHVSIYIANIANKVADTRNDKMTQGILIYECLMLSNDSFRDSLTEVEETINQHLIGIGVNPDAIDSFTNKDIDDSTNKFKNISDNIESEKEAKAKEENEEYEAKDAEDTRRIRVWLPEYIKEQADFSRGWGTKIDEAVVKAYISPYTDRYDRLDIKKDILENKESGEYRRDISREIIESNSEKAIDNWSEYEENVNSQTEMDTRLEYLHSISKNMNMSYAGFVNMYQNVHGVNKKRAKDVILNLAKKYKILWMNSKINEIYITVDNINSIAKYRGSTYEEKIMLFGEMLEQMYEDKKIELDKDEITVNVDMFKSILYNLDLVNDRKRNTAGLFIAEKYNIADYHTNSNVIVLKQK